MSLAQVHEELRALFEAAETATGTCTIGCQFTSKPPVARLASAQGDFTVTEVWAGELLSLRIFPELEPAETERVAEVIASWETATQRASSLGPMGLRRTVRLRLADWSVNSETVARWREQRYRRFMDLCQVRPDEPILDVGAGAGRALARYNKTNPIVAVDLSWPAYSPNWLDQPNVRFVQADATELPFADREFPVAFSNAVIQYVPKEKQEAFAAEIRRVSERYFVQTQNKWFPLEPYYQVPFVHFLPKVVLRWMARRVGIGWRKKGQWEPINLLVARELRRLFPDAEIHRERAFGLTKSLVAVRRPRPALAGSGSTRAARARSCCSAGRSSDRLCVRWSRT